MTILTATVHFVLYQYATFTETVTLTDSDGVPRNLTGYTALMHVRRDPDDADPLFTLSTADSTIVLGGVLGTVVLAIPFSDTDVTVDTDGETWFYDLLLTDTAPTPDVVEKPITGTITAFRGITRPS
jgi:hypothetical protein